MAKVINSCRVVLRLVMRRVMRRWMRLMARESRGHLAGPSSQIEALEFVGTNVKAEGV